MALEHLDMESLNTLKEVMGDEFPQLVDTFITDSDVRIVNIRESVDAGDPEAFRRAAHSLKGSASNMGALRLTEHCRRLESLGFNGKTEGSELIVEDISTAYAAVSDALKAL